MSRSRQDITLCLCFARSMRTAQLDALAGSLKHQSELPVCFRLIQEPSNAISGGPRSALGRTYGEGGHFTTCRGFGPKFLITYYEIKWSSGMGRNGQRIVNSQEVEHKKSCCTQEGGGREECDEQLSQDRVRTTYDTNI